MPLFGKGSFDYVKGGGGSGDVTVSYVHNLYDGFQMLHDAVSLYEPLCDFYRANVNEQYDQGSVPGMTTEPALSAELLAGAQRLYRHGCDRIEPFFRRRLGPLQHRIQRGIQSVGDRDQHAENLRRDLPGRRLLSHKGRIRHDRAGKAAFFQNCSRPKYRRHHRYLLDQK